MLNLDASLFGIALLIGILLFILNKIYYKPIGKVLGDRESKIANDNSLIEAKTREIEMLTLSIEKQLKDAQKEARKTREDLVKKGEEAREKLLLDAREKAKEIFDTRMKRLDEEILAAQKKLEQQIDIFSEKIKEIFIK
jgi:F-type H+-transporting ATPase subunit b